MLQLNVFRAVSLGFFAVALCTEPPPLLVSSLLIFGFGLLEVKRDLLCFEDGYQRARREYVKVVAAIMADANECIRKAKSDKS